MPYKNPKDPRKKVSQDKRNRRYREQHPARLAESTKLSSRRYRSKHPELKTKFYKARDDWREKNPEKFLAWQKAYRLKKKMAFATRPMPEVCEICARPPSGTSRASSTLHLDHDHATGKFRGWLCQKCNMILGQIEDNVAWLESLSRYLVLGVTLYTPKDSAARNRQYLRSIESNYA